jgi:hypothetical protein
VGPRVGLDGCEKSRPYWDSVSGSDMFNSKGIFHRELSVPLLSTCVYSVECLKISLFTKVFQIQSYIDVFTALLKIDVGEFH